MRQRPHAHDDEREQHAGACAAATSPSAAAPSSRRQGSPARTATSPTPGKSSTSCRGQHAAQVGSRRSSADVLVGSSTRNVRWLDSAARPASVIVPAASGIATVAALRPSRCTTARSSRNSGGGRPRRISSRVASQTPRPVGGGKAQGRRRVNDDGDGMDRTALQSWGSFDRDNPFPLFADVREHGPVHAITLADGHAAWLVIRSTRPSSC